jgi:glutathione peroxidase-family protein
MCFYHCKPKLGFAVIDLPCSSLMSAGPGQEYNTIQYNMQYNTKYNTMQNTL